ncbi:MAG: inorganic phosphate transporter, partial [Waddliaceae bacterium]
MSPETLLLGFILVAGFYMAWNIGANDVANALGTSVGSGALTLRHAVILAAILEFSGAFFFGSYVSATIQKGIIYSDVFIQDPRTLVYGMLASLLATGMWLQIASSFGLPVSTTHCIVGSVVGFGAVFGGLHAIKWGTVLFIISSWMLSPLIGGCLAYYLFSLLRKKIFYSFHPVREAKKLTPILVFFIIAIFSHLLIFDGIKQWEFELHLFQAFGISILAGLIGALISYFCVRRISVNPSMLQTRPCFGSEIPNSLEKARKHLARIQSSASSDLKYKATLLIEEIDNLSFSLHKNIEKKVTHSEYASVEKIFGYLQILSASLMAFAHGANDVANAIGPLSAAIGILTSGVIAMQ